MNLVQIISGCMILGALHMSSHTACAALGGGIDSIAADRTALKGVHRATTSHGGYSVEEVKSDTVMVREYVSSSGVVFGVAWDGYVHPDLSQLLGGYWAEYSGARGKAQRKFGRSRQRITTSAVVVESWGHMRSLRGRAYVPGLIPAGVSVDDIR